MKFSVAHAQGEKGHWIHLEKSQPMTVYEAISSSPLMGLYPELDLEQCKLGVFGKICISTTLVKEGDRVEIYLPIRRIKQENGDE